MSLVILGIPGMPVLGGSSAVASSTGLSTIVLSKTLYGLVQSPHGPANGPVTLSNFKHLPVYFPGERTLEGEMANGGAIGYVRTWVNKPADGDAVFILAMQFKKSSEARAFSSVAQSNLRNEGLDEFLVHGLPEGFELLATQSALGKTEYIVDFAKGKYFFGIAVVNGLGDISTADAATLAKEQNSRAPAA